MGDTNTLPVLPEQTPILARPNGTLRIGCDPADAVIVTLEPKANPRAVAKLLSELRTPLTRTQLRRRIHATGLTVGSFNVLMSQLVDAGKAAVPHSKARRLRVRVHGTGSLARLLSASLAETGTLIETALRPSQQLDCNLLVLADLPIPDPAVRLALMSSGTPHLPVVVRDGIGVIGPLVLPGLSSCLRCADLHRCAIDPEWPTLAPQLADSTGDADGPTVAATAGVAHREVLGIEQALSRPDGPAPQSLNARLLVNAAHAGTRLVPAPPHPRCGCVHTLPSAGSSRYPHDERKGSVERHHTGAGPTQCETGGVAARRSRAGHRRSR